VALPPPPPGVGRASVVVPPPSLHKSPTSPDVSARGHGNGAVAALQRAQSEFVMGSPREDLDEMSDVLSLPPPPV